MPQFYAFHCYIYPTRVEVGRDFRKRQVCEEQFLPWSDTEQAGTCQNAVGVVVQFLFWVGRFEHADSQCHGDIYRFRLITQSNQFHFNAAYPLRERLVLVERIRQV